MAIKTINDLEQDLYNIYYQMEQLDIDDPLQYNIYQDLKGEYYELKMEIDNNYSRFLFPNHRITIHNSFRSTFSNNSNKRCFICNTPILKNKKLIHYRPLLIDHTTKEKLILVLPVTIYRRTNDSICYDCIDELPMTINELDMIAEDLFITTNLHRNSKTRFAKQILNFNGDSLNFIKIGENKEKQKQRQLIKKMEYNLTKQIKC